MPPTLIATLAACLLSATPDINPGLSWVGGGTTPSDIHGLHADGDGASRPCRREDYVQGQRNELELNSSDRYRYDSKGRIVEERHFDGRRLVNRSLLSYRGNRIVRTSDSCELDAACKLDGVIDERVEWILDESDRWVRETSWPGEDVTTWTYSDDGRRVTEKCSGWEAEYELDLHHRLIRKRETLFVGPRAPRARSIEVTYPTERTRVTRWDEDGDGELETTDETRFDETGRRLEDLERTNRKDPSHEGTRTEYRRDGRGRLLEVSTRSSAGLLTQRTVYSYQCAPQGPVVPMRDELDVKGRDRR